MNMTSSNSDRRSSNELISYWLETFSSKNDLNEARFYDRKLKLEDLWQLMDKVWDEMGCNNTEIDFDKLSAYYQHPIWLLNGFFIENDELSLHHRHSMTDWIASNSFKKILDFGGGFGTLARMISGKTSSISVDIYEPYPSETAIRLCKYHQRINFVDKLHNNYDCLVSTDVLEHVSDPLQIFAQMISCVKIGGYLMIANHFYPSIKCHLPTTFHLRYSFDKFAKEMGLQKISLCHGSCAVIYQKISGNPLDWQKIRRTEFRSKIFFPFLELKYIYMRTCKKRLKRVMVDSINALKNVRLTNSQM
jgi:2-polyprenyl-3-methyl-5-hydroxy-6-metoxy-1,4-benzoquinol methylase